MCDVCGTTTTPEKALSYSIYGKNDLAVDEADMCSHCGAKVMHFRASHEEIRKETSEMKQPLSDYLTNLASPSSYPEPT